MFSWSDLPTIPRLLSDEYKVFEEEEHPPFVAVKGPRHGSTLRKTGINANSRAATGNYPPAGTLGCEESSLCLVHPELRLLTRFTIGVARFVLNTFGVTDEAPSSDELPNIVFVVCVGHGIIHRVMLDSLSAAESQFLF